MENQRFYTFEKIILPSKDYYIDFRTNSETSQETFFKNIVFNMGASVADIRVYFNGSSHGLKVNAGVILPLNDEKINTIRIENLDAVNNAEFEFTIDNKLSQLELLKILAFGDLEARK